MKQFKIEKESVEVSDYWLVFAGVVLGAWTLWVILVFSGVMLK